MGVELYTKTGDHEEVAALKKHGLRFRFRGLPIFDEDTDEIIGITTEPEWEWDNLTAKQRTYLDTVAKADAETHDVTYDFAISATTAVHGVTCPHRWMVHKEIHQTPYKECARCRTLVQLPGRVAQVGDDVIIVPDPPPLRLVVPVKQKFTSASYTKFDDASPVECLIDVVEYEWTGREYRKVGP